VGEGEDVCDRAEGEVRGDVVGIGEVRGEALWIWGVGIAGLLFGSSGMGSSSVWLDTNGSIDDGVTDGIGPASPTGSVGGGAVGGCAGLMLTFRDCFCGRLDCACASWCVESDLSSVCIALCKTDTRVLLWVGSVGLGFGSFSSCFCASLSVDFCFVCVLSVRKTLWMVFIMLVRMLGVEGLGGFGLSFISKDDFLDLSSSVEVGGASAGGASAPLVSCGLLTVMFTGESSETHSSSSAISVPL
jgi:hypothetical protein